MFTKNKLRFFVSSDETDNTATNDYEQIKAKVWKRRRRTASVFVFLVVVFVVLVKAFVAVQSGEVRPFIIGVIVVMAGSGLYGTYRTHCAGRDYKKTLVVNGLAVACYGLGMLLVIPLLFKYSNAFRHLTASVTGHESFDGSVGIVGHTPWYLLLFSLGIVIFLVYGLMVLSIVASLSGMVYFGDENYVGKKPKKPKNKKWKPKRAKDESRVDFERRKMIEFKDFEKEKFKAKMYYLPELLLWHYRKLVTTGLAPIWLCSIAVICGMLFVSESYFNAVF